MTVDPRLTLAITGASGMPYALTLLGALLEREQEVLLLVSDAAREVLRLEMDFELPADSDAAAQAWRARCGSTKGILRVLGKHEWTAAPASGSGAPRRMVICPCSMGTLAAIAAGLSNNLIERAADVVLKEGHRLILLPREMPFSALHLNNMARLARLGATVMPPCPAFYQQPQSLQDLVDFVVDRVLAQLDLPGLLPGWGRDSPQHPTPA
ncbi:MAG: putative aromatic acid decarboxylase [Moraxellaceae bacterium]|jgi:4-hydroxy-3-polyprenylbenzoate decarboxylase|nr:putative aromatic acid decarboxylase [Moraxellaceae bacterium]